MLQGRTIFTLPLEGSCMRFCMSSYPFTSHTYVEGMTIFILIMYTLCGGLQWKYSSTQLGIGYVEEIVLNGKNLADDSGW